MKTIAVLFSLLFLSTAAPPPVFGNSFTYTFHATIMETPNCPALGACNPVGFSVGLGGPINGTLTLINIGDPATQSASITAQVGNISLSGPATTARIFRFPHDDTYFVAVAHDVALNLDFGIVSTTFTAVCVTAPCTINDAGGLGWGFSDAGLSAFFSDTRFQVRSGPHGLDLLRDVTTNIGQAHYLTAGQVGFTSMTAPAIPEPSTWILLATGLMLMAGLMLLRTITGGSKAITSRMQDQANLRRLAILRRVSPARNR